jgi:hypothetical protein
MSILKFSVFGNGLFNFSRIEIDGHPKTPLTIPLSVKMLTLFDGAI